MFINISNHPSSKWSPEQLAAASQYGKIVDIQFPNIPAEADHSEVESLAWDYVIRAEDLLRDPATERAKDGSHAIHVMGETSFVVAFVRNCRLGVPLVCSTTAREVVDLGDGKKEARFRFVQFRQMAKE